MKKVILVLYSFAVLSVSAVAQPHWILQRATGLPNSLDPEVQFTAVDEDVCWGVNTINSQYLRTTNGGIDWEVAAITGATGLRGSSITALDANTAWVAMNHSSNVTSGIFRTTDGGSTWTNDTTAFQGSGAHPNIIHFFDSQSGVCVGNPRNGYWEIYTTSNGGSNWTRIPSMNIPPPLPTDELGIYNNEARSRGNSLWFGTFWGSLYRTTDRGMTWSVARTILGDLAGFGFAFKDSLNGLACSHVNGDKISCTTDGGGTWTPMLLTGLSGVSPFYIAHVKGTDSSYVITSNSNLSGINQAVPGSAYSLNSGASWNYINSLPYGPASFSSWNIGWCGGVNDSVYQWAGFPTDVRDNSLIVEGFRLHQNYPNPFNPTTTIRYELPERTNVSLKIHNILGQAVLSLVESLQEAGYHEIALDASHLATGVYFYRLSAGGFTDMKRLVVLK